MLLHGLEEVPLVPFPLEVLEVLVPFLVEVPLVPFLVEVPVILLHRLPRLRLKRSGPFSQ